MRSIFFIQFFRRFQKHLALSLCLWCPAYLSYAPNSNLPEGFVYVDEVIPDIHWDLKYFSAHNFVGKVIDGYEADKLILTRPAAEALLKVQNDLRQFGLAVKVFDAYRPQPSVDHFVKWAQDINDIKTKKIFYPNVPKNKLFELDYIAEQSSHTRGSTVDLTIIDINFPHAELDMGSPFDFFDPVSWPTSQAISPQQKANRMLLQSIMKKHGFKHYPKEWWHFTLIQEPYPETYFSFPIK